MHLLWILVLLVSAAATPALHKCIGADGVASYQSLPCTAGQRTAWTRQPEPLAAAPAPAPVKEAPVKRSRGRPRKEDTFVEGGAA